MAGLDVSARPVIAILISDNYFWNGQFRSVTRAFLDYFHFNGRFVRDAFSEVHHFLLRLRDRFPARLRFTIADVRGDCSVLFERFWSRGFIYRVLSVGRFLTRSLSFSFSLHVRKFFTIVLL